MNEARTPFPTALKSSVSTAIKMIFDEYYHFIEIYCQNH